MTELLKLTPLEKELTEKLRVMTQKHEAACQWALNNAACFKSHLNVCKHDLFEDGEN